MISLRYLIAQRGYLTLSLATLALAVGANLFVFTIVNALWLRPRPVTDPDRVVMVMGDTGSTGTSERFFFAEMGLQMQVRDAVSAFALVAGQVMTTGANAGLTPRISFDAVAHPVETIGVTPEYFPVLGLAILGRGFGSDDDRPGASPVAVISDRLWKSAFNGEADVIGRLIPASPFPLRIVGVASPGFHGARLGEDVDVWVPRGLVPRVSALDDVAQTPMLAIARLQPGVTAATAQRLVAEHAGGGRPSIVPLVVVPLSMVYGSPNHRTLVINEGPVVRVIATTAIFVLIGGCATLMALVLVHYERRRHEFAVRLALGASQWRLVRRLSAELAWLVALGSGGALLVAFLSVRALPALDLPGGVNLSRLDLGFDWRVWLAGISAAAITLGLGAILPLLRFTHGRVARHLISPGSTATGDSLRLRKIMLGIHVAATVIVLVAAGLFVRSVHYGFTSAVGFDIERTLFVSVDVGSPYDFSAARAMERVRGVPAPTSLDERTAENRRLVAALGEQRRSARKRVLDALVTWPTIETLALGPPPLGPDRATDISQPKIFETETGRREMRAGRLLVEPGYIHALGLRIRRGRALTDADAQSPENALPAVVTASLAETLWPNQSVVGRRVRVGYSPLFMDHTIVGVVDDFAYGSMRFDPPAAILTAAPANAQLAAALHFVVQTKDPPSMVEPLRRALTSLAPDDAHIAVVTGRDLVAADLGRERLGAWFFSGFGAVAVALGIGGVFGLIAYLAESRRREFGVRIALGASPGSIVRLALMAGAVPAAAGAGVGLIGAVWLAKVAESFLIGVSRLDPVSYGAAFGLMLAAASGAGLAAAWRVRRISPMTALRDE